MTSQIDWDRRKCENPLIYIYRRAGQIKRELTKNYHPQDLLEKRLGWKFTFRFSFSFINNRIIAALVWLMLHRLFRHLIKLIASQFDQCDLLQEPHGSNCYTTPRYNVLSDDLSLHEEWKSWLMDFTKIAHRIAKRNQHDKCGIDLETAS